MMNKTEFLAALRHELGFLPKDELDDAIRYYDEYINDAGDDEEKVERWSSVWERIRRRSHFEKRVINLQS